MIADAGAIVNGNRSALRDAGGQCGRRGAYPRARFREAEQIARKGDVARMNNAIPYRYLPPANCIRSECRTSDACPCGREWPFSFFSAGVCCRSVRARGYAPLRGGRFTGAWIRAPTRRCVSERWRSQFQSRRETANSQFSILNSPFSSRTAAWGQAALRHGLNSYAPDPWSLIPAHFSLAKQQALW